jgi:tetratricopeptide (TPR) repeat protein
MRTILIAMIAILLSCVGCQADPNLDTQINYIQKAIQEHPNNPDLHFQLGQIYEVKGKHNAAKVELGIAIKLKPEHAKANNLMGHIFRAEGNYPLSIEYYQKAIQGDARFMEPYIMLAGLYREIGIKSRTNEHTGRTIDILKIALKNCDRNVHKDQCINILNNLAVAYLANDSGAHDSRLNEVIYCSELGLELLKNEDDLKRYVSYQLDAKKIRFGKGLFYYYLGQAYRELNKPNPARDAYNKSFSEFKKIEDKYWMERVEKESKVIKA